MIDPHKLRFFSPVDWLRVIRWQYFDPDKTSAYRVAFGSFSLRQTGGTAALVWLLLVLLIPTLAFAAGTAPGLAPMIGSARASWGLLTGLLLVGALVMAAFAGIGDDHDAGVLLTLLALLLVGWFTTALLGAAPLQTFGAAGMARMEVIAAVFFFLAVYGISEVANELGGLVPVGAALGLTLAAAWSPARALLAALAADAPFWLAVVLTTFGVLALLLIAALLLGRAERWLKRRSPRFYGILRLLIGAVGILGIVWLFWLGGWRVMV